MICIEMYWTYIFLAILIYLIIVGCLCTSIRVIPYNRDTDLAYAKVTESFEAREGTNNYATSLGKEPEPILCKKVHGFKGLQCCPNANPEMFDKFAFTEGKKGCDGIGLFNSKGSLCLNKDQTRLLMTRGGNMSGPDAQIGP